MDNHDEEIIPRPLLDEILQNLAAYPRQERIHIPLLIDPFFEVARGQNAAPLVQNAETGQPDAQQPAAQQLLIAEEAGRVDVGNPERAQGQGTNNTPSHTVPGNVYITTPISLPRSTAFIPSGTDSLSQQAQANQLNSARNPNGLLCHAVSEMTPRSELDLQAQLEEMATRYKNPLGDQGPAKPFHIVTFGQQQFSRRWQANDTNGPQSTTHFGPVTTAASFMPQFNPGTQKNEWVMTYPPRYSSSALSASGEGSGENGSSNCSSNSSTRSQEQTSPKDVDDKRVLNEYYQEYERIMSKRRGRQFVKKMQSLTVDVTNTPSDSSAPSTECSVASPVPDPPTEKMEMKPDVVSQQPKLYDPEEKVSFECQLRRAILTSLKGMTCCRKGEEDEAGPSTAKKAPKMTAREKKEQKRQEKLKRTANREKLLRMARRRTGKKPPPPVSRSPNQILLQKCRTTAAGPKQPNRVDCSECGRTVLEDDYPRHLQTHGMGRRSSRTAVQRIAENAVAEATVQDFEELPIDVNSDGEDDTTYGSKKRKNKKKSKK